jgi:hypothetical protein
MPAKKSFDRIFMKPFQPSSIRFGLFLYAAGILLAFVLIVLSTWADVEALFYGFPRMGNQAMNGLSCPLLITEAGNDRFSVTLTNSTRQQVRPVLRTDISNAGLWRTYSTPVALAPGESKTNSWEISAEDRVLENYVFIKAYTYAAYPLPNSEGTCGIFVARIPWIGGSLLTWLWIIVSVGLIGSGVFLSKSKETSAGKPGLASARLAMAAMAVFGLAVSLVGWWLFGLLVVTLMVLTLAGMLFAAFSR